MTSFSKFKIASDVPNTSTKQYCVRVKADIEREAMLAEVSVIISAIALVVSLYSLYLYNKQFEQTTGIAIQHQCNNLPPYHSDEDTTKIIVQNAGNAVALIESTQVYYSWNNNAIVHLDYECEEGEEYCLSPNESHTFYERLLQPPSKGKHELIIITRYDGIRKRERFPIRVKSIQR